MNLFLLLSWTSGVCTKRTNKTSISYDIILLADDCEKQACLNLCYQKYSTHGTTSMCSGEKACTCFYICNS